MNLTSRQFDVSLVLPAYNPGTRLRQTLHELGDFLAVPGDRWEVLFVCDGCTDGTLDLLNAWKPARGSARVISYSPNRGKGYAVRQGLLAASAPFRIFTDIDLAYPFADIERVLRRLRAGSEAVIGSRTHSDSIVELPARSLGYAYRRQIQSRVFGRIVRTLLPLTNGDTQAGLKGFTESAVRRIVPRLACNGFGFDCELLTACVRAGIRVEEVPVHVRYDDCASTTNFGSTVRMVRELWRIRKAWPAGVAFADQITDRYREAG
ncbi:MAG: glycosyltransferase [Gemmataceae bacterium]|nr:glycosyltransferase [Gemmataceae bacterium]